jgi:hypothetical protein
MGNDASFAEIKKKYGSDGVNYVLAKYQSRQVNGKIND